MQYPDGKDINTGNDHEAAKRQTKAFLENENITLFEPLIEIDQKIIRIDILNKVGNHYELIEVKSKSFNSDEDIIKQKKGLKEYIMDLAYSIMYFTNILAKAKNHLQSLRIYFYLIRVKEVK